MWGDTIKKLLFVCFVCMYAGMYVCMHAYYNAMLIQTINFLDMYIYILKPNCTPRSTEQFESRQLDMYIYILKPNCTPRSPEQFESRHLDMYIYIYTSTKLYA